MTPVQAAYRAVIARKTLPHGQRPTDTHIKVMWFLAKWQHATPSHAKIAKAAGCHRNTVGNALHRLRDLGLLDWDRRFVRIGGGQFAQASNSYRFPSNASLPPARAATVGKDKKNPSFIGPQSLCIGDRTAALQALARVRTAMEGRLLAGIGR
jgi:DNA-binding transcriptional MocR family regulator